MKKPIAIFLALLMLVSCSQPQKSEIPDSAHKIIVRPRGMIMFEEVYTDGEKITKILDCLRSFSEVPPKETKENFGEIVNVGCTFFADYEIILDDENFVRKNIHIDGYQGEKGERYKVMKENYLAFEATMSTLTPDNTPILKYEYGNLDSYKEWMEKYEELN